LTDRVTALPARRWEVLPRLRRPPIDVVLVLTLIGIAVAALTQGAANIPLADVTAILGHEVGVDLPWSSIVPGTWERIVVDVRLPRILAAALVGAALALSGSSYQGVFRNPLAGPFLLGVASGAALGAALAIVLPLPPLLAGPGWVPVFAFVGALIAVVSVHSVAGRQPDTSTLILAGVALSSMLGAATAFILFRSGEQSMPIFAFLFGSLNQASWERIAWSMPYFVVGQLGINVPRTRLLILAAASLVAAAAVSVAGVIGFLGLIVPHVTRLLFGGDHRQLLRRSALIGASTLIAVDLVARTALAPQEIPIGILTALAGGPFFLWLLRARPGATAL
jgi:iron complex transport system permease protein